MAPLKPVLWMGCWSAALWITIAAAAGFDHAGDVLLGALAPAVAACVSWTILERVQRTAPEESTRTMIRLLMGKAILFGAYMAILLGRRLVAPVPFIMSFSATFIALHVVQAVYLRRLFAPRV